MTVETISGLVNFGIGGAVIVVVILFLKFIEKRDATVRESYDTRDRLWREFFTNLTTTNTAQFGPIKIALDNLIEVTGSLVDKVQSLESNLYLHDIRVDKLVEKMDNPRVAAPSMMKGRKDAGKHEN